MANIKQGKVWGSTAPLFNKNNVSIHKIHIDPQSYCSKHKHEHRHNMFYVESGELTISIWQNAYNLVDKTTLKAGEMLFVSPGKYHQFENNTNEPVIALEIYYTELNEDDIIRENTGGVRTPIVTRKVK